MKKTIVLLFYCFIVLLLLVSPVWAQNGDNGEEDGGIINPVIGAFGRQEGQTTLAYLIALFLKLSLVGGVILLLIYLALGGLQWLTSGGDKAAVAAAREKLTAALIGLFLLSLVYLIATLVGQFLKLEIFAPKLPRPPEISPE